ncbi:MAG: preprotein translocase subunit SecY [Candidatus Babeliales bacterium]
MIVLRSFTNIFKITELRRKIFFTLGVLIVSRLGTYVPVIGVNVPMLSQYMQQAAGLGGLLNYLDTFSGGALSKCTLFALGIGPYITASIMMQLLGMTIPYLEQLLKEGDYGRKIINQYTRYLTLGLSLFYSFLYAMALEKQGLVLDPGWAFRFVFMISLTAGALFVMWLGEQISLHGIGNGSSMIIFSGIVARFPDHVIKTVYYIEQGYLDALVGVLILVGFVGITACIVYLERGERKIPVQYARRVVGNKVYAGQSSYIPFKINTVGVMPVIFASSLLSLPIQVSTMLAERYPSLRFVVEAMGPQGVLFNVFEFLLIIFFSYAYTAMIFNPEELAQNMKKSGGFIPGIRPGKKTAEFFDYILNRIGFVGAIYLGLLAVLPNLVTTHLGIPFYLGGTSILIAVGVALETSAQMETYLIERRYDGFLATGRVKSSGGVR